jgi:DNA gyrase/topoisomerase IV subunit B
LDHWEAVRRRPGMYFGDRAPLAVVRLVVEDAVLGRGATCVRVEFLSDGHIQVEDDGRCFREEDFSWSERHTAPCYPHDTLNYLLLVCAASETFKAEGGLIRVIMAGTGRPAISRVAESQAGNLVRLRLDGGLFQGAITPAPFEVFGWAQEFAALVSGTRLVISDSIVGERTYLYPAGLADYLAEWTWVRSRISRQVVHFSADMLGGQMGAALAFHCTGPKEMVSFVNFKRTVSNGAHVDGAIKALKELLSERFELSSFSLAINVNVKEPTFSGAVREKLLGKDVSRFVYEQFMRHGDATVRAAREP